MPNTAQHRSNCNCKQQRQQQPRQPTHMTGSRTLPRRLRADRRRPTPRPGSVSIHHVVALLACFHTGTRPGAWSLARMFPQHVSTSERERAPMLQDETPHSPRHPPRCRGRACSQYPSRFPTPASP
jgi:hypothetical protein